jgi:hypothetical protein
MWDGVKFEVPRFSDFSLKAAQRAPNKRLDQPELGVGFYSHPYGRVVRVDDRKRWRQVLPIAGSTLLSTIGFENSHPREQPPRLSSQVLVKLSWDGPRTPPLREEISTESSLWSTGSSLGVRGMGRERNI